MDGLKCTIPNSCTNIEEVNYTLFGEETVKKCCSGCKKNLLKQHNGIYVKIMDWNKGKPIKFVSLL